jgi:hypothetical protein
MSSNIFNGKRFLLLCKQYFIHNTNFLLLSGVAYIGMVFIVLSVTQVVNGFQTHELDVFQVFLIGFVIVFAILYVGHSFPAFRSKESTINYLMIPASVLEKFVFELMIRIVIMIPTLPLLYWITFHLQGYLFAIFTNATFQPIGLEYLIKIDAPDDYKLLIYTLTASAALLALVLAFTGAAIFTKQPLAKSLFSVAVIVIFYMAYIYIIVTHVGVGRYNPPETMFLVPTDEAKALGVISIALIITIAVMLFVAFRKLKEREV